MKSSENSDHFCVPERADRKRFFAFIVRIKEKLGCFKSTGAGNPAKKVPPCQFYVVGRKTIEYP
jgi:hypothetical protein